MKFHDQRNEWYIPQHDTWGEENKCQGGRTTTAKLWSLDTNFQVDLGFCENPLNFSESSSTTIWLFYTPTSWNASIKFKWPNTAPAKAILQAFSITRIVECNFAIRMRHCNRAPDCSYHRQNTTLPSSPSSPLRQICFLQELIQFDVSFMKYPEFPHNCPKS